MKLHIKIVLTIIVTLLLLIYLAGFLPAFSQTPPNWVITGRIMAPGPETTEDIASWIPVTDAILTLTDIEGDIHIVTTGKDGYYFFSNLAVDANCVITAIAIVNGKTMVFKDVIPEPVAAPETYDAGTADAESTALALIVEELIKQGLTPEDIDLEIIQDSENFKIVEDQILSVLEENGNVMDDIIVAGEEVVSGEASEITGDDTLDFEATVEEGTAYRVTVALRSPGTTAQTSRDTYTITASFVGSGTIEPSGAVTVNKGLNQTFTITPDPNYHILGITVDGNLEVGPFVSPYTYTFTNVTNDHTIEAYFATYTITASVVGSGTIIPSGAVSVNHGSTPTFTITPDPNYHIDDVLVDGNPVRAVSSYTFKKVTANHAIEATFAIDTYTLTTSVGSNGAISPSEITVDHGADQSFTITPDPNYHIDDVLVDGISLGAVDSYTFDNVTEDGHSIEASFAIDTYTLTMYTDADGTGSGTVSPTVGVHTYNYGDKVNIKATAGTDSDFTYWLQNANIDKTAKANTKVTMNGDQTVTASFTLKTYTLTVTVDGTGSGTVSPVAGVYIYNYGDVVTIGATPGTTFVTWVSTTADIDSIFAGWSGDASGTGDATLFMDSDKSVTATFDLKKVTLTMSVDGTGSGTVSPTVGVHTYNYGDKVNIKAKAGTDSDFTNWITNANIDNIAKANTKVTMNGDQTVAAIFTFSVALNTDATLSDLTVDGITIAGFSSSTYIYAVELLPGTTTVPEVGATTNASKEITQAKNVTSNAESQRTAKVLVTAEDGSTKLTYKVIFSVALNTYTITASTGSGGSIDPSGAVTVNHGSSKSFAITPTTNYHIVDVLVDRESKGVVSSYTFDNVTDDHTIEATFAIDTYTITASAGSNGSISPEGAVSVNYNLNKSFTIEPDDNYHISEVLVDGGSVGAVDSYTFTDVTAVHIIFASFAIDTYTITASAGSNGSISPSGDVTVNHGADQTFTITPDTNYHIEDVLVDGESKGVVSSYTFTNVTADHTISASFNPAAVSFAVTTENLGTETASTAFSVTITAKDIEGNTATGYTGSHNIIWSWTASNSPEGTEPTKPADGDQTFSNGTVTVTGFTLTNSSETPTITAIVGSVSGTTAPITVTAGNLFSITVTPASVNVAAGGTEEFSAQGYDQYGNPISGLTYTWSVINGEGTINASTGVFTAGTTPGTYTDTVKAVSGGKSDTATLTVEAGAFDHIVISPDSATITAGETQNYTAEAFDADDISLGYVTSDTTFKIKKGKGAGGSWDDNVYTSEKAGAWTVTGTYGKKSKKKEDTATLTVAAGDLHHFDFNTIGNQELSMPFSITITAKDASGNTVTGYTGTGNLSDTTGTIDPTSTGNFASGEWTGNVTITVAKNNVVITIDGNGSTGESNKFKVKKN